MAGFLSAIEVKKPRPLALTLLGVCGLHSTPAQTASPASVLDGIYTQQQALRGETAYRQSCASCHGEKLDGRDQTPPLAGGDFTSNWEGMSVGDLFDKIQALMPADRPGQLSREKNAEILAYILKVNSFPAGAKELVGSDALKAIRFQAKK